MGTPTCHGKATDQQTNISPPDYDGFAALFCIAAVFGFPRSPYSNQKYNEVEQDDSYQSFYMKSHFYLR